MDLVYDCIVVGLGAHGSSCIAKLAKENKRVLGLEKFTRVHKQGSSHGRSRVIRQAYFEDPRYVPLVKRSFELWRDLASFEAQRHNSDSLMEYPSLLNDCGGLMIGSPESEIITGTLEAIRVHNLPHEILTAKEIRERYPVLTPGDDLIGVYETEAGYLVPETCLEAHLQMAEDFGATLIFEEAFVSHSIENNDCDEQLLSISTNLNNTYLTKKLVLTVGAWAPEIFGNDIPISLRTERRVLFWFNPSTEDCDEALSCFRQIPVFLWDNSSGDNMCQFYGFPCERSGMFSKSVKIARHQPFVSEEMPSPECSPASIDRNLGETEVKSMQDIMQGKVDSLALGSLEAFETCMYTMTPDENFLIDFHPKNKNIILASPCSGHGFKFSSVIGEILKDLVLYGESSHDISLFSIKSRLI